MNPTILIVEDEPAQLEMLKYNLEKARFSVMTATDGDDARLLLVEETPDLVVLDWMLPGRSGMELCRWLRSRPETRTLPIIMLTARGEEADRIRGLEAGADDYVVKPYSPSEVVARVRAVLRRTRPDLSAEMLEHADVVMDLVELKVLRDGRPIHLSPLEFRLLRLLMERPGRVYSREQLLDRVWGRDVYLEERTVDVHIRRLRKALNQNGGSDIIRTVRSEGYALDNPAAGGAEEMSR